MEKAIDTKRAVVGTIFVNTRPFLFSSFVSLGAYIYTALGAAMLQKLLYFFSPLSKTTFFCFFFFSPVAAPLMMDTSSTARVLLEPNHYTVTVTFISSPFFTLTTAVVVRVSF